MTPTGELRWHYGPTADNPDPGRMWHYDCGGEVMFIEDRHVCMRCDRHDGPDPADLTAFLEAQWDEDEKLARACVEEIGAHRAGEMYDDGSGAAHTDAFPSYPWGSDERELAFMAGPAQPARVLAEVAAKRAILEQYRRALQGKDWPTCSALEEVLPVLAQSFRGAPGWRNEWAIED